MSNCINSGINKVFILTQFNSQSLNRHLAKTYNFGNGVNFGDGFVEVLGSSKALEYNSTYTVSFVFELGPCNNFIKLFELGSSSNIKIFM